MCEYCGTGISYQNSSQTNYQTEGSEMREQRRSTSCMRGCNPCTGCRG